MTHNRPMTPFTSKPGRGRPREFNYDEVVDSAIGLFRQRGFGATSIADLVEATSLTRGSLYKAFTDKKSVYVAALERYVRLGHERIRAIAGGQGTGRERVAKLLAYYLEQSRSEPGRLGCLVVATGLEATVVDPDIARMFEQALKYLEQTLSELIRIGIEDHSIRVDVNTKAAAKALLCFLQGLRVVGKSDLHRDHLDKAMLDMAMRILD
ncbi:TetR/AcrR family transcriptional regulator [Cupriavidus pauculus]|uniref:TetR/AcrR family transcriptional regulator n=1 Tax=Cupriavidus pauculus TaxID=82633 RepID=UPI001EE17E46|nr:TetR/AcrR family transcriptional regulator [Cupriavidus pauculus]GJG95057.1 TetR/AcrR family transcriptional regulator [Cupriavidus pauculus]